MCKPLHRCSHLPNATQWDATEAATVTESAFGRREVESRLNVSSKEHGHYHTLECVASTEGEEAFTLFSISGTETSCVFVCVFVRVCARCVVTGCRLTQIRPY